MCLFVFYVLFALPAHISSGLQIGNFFSLQSGKAHQVSQFHIVNWNTDGSCANLKTITDVIEEVTKVQMRSGNNPIVVHCR